MGASARWQVLHGNCLEVLKTLPDNSIDAVVTDPPYGLSEHADIQTMVRYWFVGKEFVNKSSGFMGKDWDSFVPGPEIWREVLRVLKPGGHLLAFSGSRTVDLMGISIRFAGFEMRDSIMCWLYGSGFPKSLNVSKAIDKAAGAERTEVVGRGKAGAAFHYGNPGEGGFGQTAGKKSGTPSTEWDITAPATEAGKAWDGWGTSLKPAFEPVLVAQKPFDATVADNVQQYGTGAMNIDGCRVPYKSEADMDQARVPQPDLTTARKERTGFDASARNGDVFDPSKGRWPPNVLLPHHPDCVEGEPCAEGCAVAELDRQSGFLHASGNKKDTGAGKDADYDASSFHVSYQGRALRDYQDGGGGASRFFPQFFYNAKASRSEREAGLEPKEGVAANIHPTVKPTAVMQWLVRLVTPPGGLVLDPFNGSGSTGVAAMKEGMRYVGIEREAAYVKIAEARIAHAATETDAKPFPKLKTPEPPKPVEPLPTPEDGERSTRSLDPDYFKKLVAKSLKKGRK